MKLSIRVPHWLVRKRVQDLEKRSALTGNASTSRTYLAGIIEVVVTVEQPHLSNKEAKE